MEKTVKNMVSCVIPTYKRCDTLVRAINSVLNQTYSNVEVLVVNDNEPNDEYTVQVRKALQVFKDESRVRLIMQEKHVNGAMARNVGIKAALGEYIGFLDDDDEWEPKKAEKQVQFLENHPDMDACACLCTRYCNGVMKRRGVPYSNKNLQFNILLRKVRIATPAFLCRKESVINSPMFDTNLKRHQELQFFAHFLENYEIGVINEYLVKIYSDDAINRPNLQNLIKIKQKWFHAVQDVINNYSIYNRYRIKCAHVFEVLYLAVKQKNIIYILICFCYVNIFIPAYIDLYRRIKERKNRQ